MEIRVWGHITLIGVSASFSATLLQSFRNPSAILLGHSEILKESSPLRQLPQTRSQ